MLDAKYIRTNPEIVSEGLAKRNSQVNLDEFLALDQKRREIIQEVEQLKGKRNTVSQDIAKLKKEKKD
ncbi:MAG: serine--tRNA ligase, partial [Clostridiales bacterium]|nr:serine--tRNA ligase [Clostridiales bacterium]